MKTILNFVIGIIILIVVWKNFDKLIEIGNALVNFAYNLIVK